MTPGAQIPRMDVGNQTAVTQALSSAAYRTGEHKELEGLAGVKWKPGKSELFRPSAGEAFSRALIDRTLAAKRNPLVPSFGTDARAVVEHCLAAQDLRDARDKQLSTITFVFGVLFLPARSSGWPLTRPRPGSAATAAPPGTASTARSRCCWPAVWHCSSRSARR